jgi:potassium-transporting ATPase KdpC subunit
MRRELATSALAIVALTLLFGFAYPLATTGLAQLLFPVKSDGSRVERDGQVIGSRLVAQDFEGDRRYFQPRPSATGYDPAGTYFNNLGPNQRRLREQLRTRLRAYLRRERPTSRGLDAADVPVDAVTTSGSGVDPHISEANARIQARRVARARRVPVTRVLELVREQTDGRALGVLGEPGVNVLELNLALDDEGAGA